MRYSDLNINFTRPKAWKLESEEALPHGLSFQDAWYGGEEFKMKKDALKDHLTKALFEPIDRSRSEEEIGILLDPVLEKMAKGYFFSENVNQDLLLKKANKNTLQKKLQSWCDQLNANVPIVRANPGIKVFYNKYRNVPCVIVAAGPSLKQAITQLATLKGKALIMAVDTSYRSLVKRGITPDFVNAHDANGPDPKTGYGGGPRFFKDIDSSQTVAAFVNYIHPQTIDAYKGPLSFYYVEDDSISTYKTMAIACDSPERKDGSFMDSGLIGGSCVAHTALYLAMKLGCNPITFVGLDLSFPDLGKSHFESDNMKNPTKDKLIEVLAVNGKKVKTNLSFYSYKTVFEKMVPILAAIESRQVYNCSENEDGSAAGIVHAGLEPMPFAEWIQKFATSKRTELTKTMEVIKQHGY